VVSGGAAVAEPACDPAVIGAVAVGPVAGRSRRLVMTQNTVPPAAIATATRLSTGDSTRVRRRFRSPGAGIV
jgi:hypothetical protein